MYQPYQASTAKYQTLMCCFSLTESLLLVVLDGVIDRRSIHGQSCCVWDPDALL